MQVRLLKTFLLVAKLMNFTQVAAKLNFTQPAITSQMHTLEDHFGVLLFERGRKKLLLTEAGERLVDYAERMLALHEEMQEAMVVFQKEVGTLTLGISTQMINHRLPLILRQLQDRLPGVNVSLGICMNTKEVLKGVINNEFNIGFIHGQNSCLQLMQHGIWKEQIIWVASSELLKKYNYNKNIMNYPIINYNVGSAFRTKIDEVMKNRSLKWSIECSDSEAVRRAVLDGLGVSFLPRVLVEDDLVKGTLMQMKEAPDFEMQISVVYRKNRKLTPLAFDLVGILADCPEADRSLKDLVSSSNQ